MPQVRVSSVSAAEPSEKKRKVFFFAPALCSPKLLDRCGEVQRTARKLLALATAGVVGLLLLTAGAWGISPLCWGGGIAVQLDVTRLTFI